MALGKLLLLLLNISLVTVIHSATAGGTCFAPGTELNPGSRKDCGVVGWVSIGQCFSAWLGRELPVNLSKIQCSLSLGLDVPHMLSGLEWQVGLGVVHFKKNPSQIHLIFLILPPTTTAQIPNPSTSISLEPLKLVISEATLGSKILWCILNSTFLRCLLCAKHRSYRGE